MKKYKIIAPIVLLASLSLHAQSRPDSLASPKETALEIGGGLVGTTGNNTPFWMRANQYGNIPVDGASATLLGRFSRDYRSGERKRIADWGVGVNAVLYAGSSLKFIPVEAYVKGKLSIFQLKVGRSKDISGLIDSTLSTGSFALSGNALGIPKVELSIPEFWNIPFLADLIAIKGAFSHGWMGQVPIQYGAQNGSSVSSYFHNASFHGRFGKPGWRVKVLGGINHEVIWGSDKLIFGDQYRLSDMEAFWHVISGKKYAKYGLTRDISKVGNHLGAVDLGLEVDLNSFRIFAYRQQFYDKGALGHLANIRDGLNGISITNNRQSARAWKWHKFLLEVFYSKDQAGEADAKETPSGAEYYYNHSVYGEGYGYKGVGLGNPLITTVAMARNNLPNAPKDYFINNRVVAFHLGNEGSVSSWFYRLKLTYSKNYGEYRTSDIPYWYNGHRYNRNPIYGIFPTVGQFSGVVEVSRSVGNGLKIGGAVAVDQGKLLYNSVGGSVKVSKTW